MKFSARFYGEKTPGFTITFDTSVKVVSFVSNDVFETEEAAKQMVRRIDMERDQLFRKIKSYEHTIDLLLKSTRAMAVFENVQERYVRIPWQVGIKDLLVLLKKQNLEGHIMKKMALIKKKEKLQNEVNKLRKKVVEGFYARTTFSKNIHVGVGKIEIQQRWYTKTYEEYLAVDRTYSHMTLEVDVSVGENGANIKAKTYFDISTLPAYYKIQKILLDEKEKTLFLTTLKKLVSTVKEDIKKDIDSRYIPEEARGPLKREIDPFFEEHISSVKGVVV